MSLLVLIIHLQILGLVLNQSYFICPSCTSRHALFGTPSQFRTTAERMGASVLGELPLVAGVSSEGDRGVPYMMSADVGLGGEEWKNTMKDVARDVWRKIGS